MNNLFVIRVVDYVAGDEGMKEGEYNICSWFPERAGSLQAFSSSSSSSSSSS